MSYGEAIERSLAGLKDKALEFSRLVNAIDVNYEGKLSEIKTLERKREKCAADVKEAEARASHILVQASEDAAKIRKETQDLIDQSRAVKEEARLEKEEAARKRAEAENLLNKARDDQRAANVQWTIMKDREKKLEAALK